MAKKKCIAMVLAGGQGSRLAALTTQIPKPAMPFGAACRLIDFSLSNCYNSGLDIVGVLTTQLGFELATAVDGFGPAVFALPPAGVGGLSSYRGTANALYENIDFIDQFSPEYVLVLSGDHVYKMDYRPFLKRHEETGAEATIAVIEVPWADASRFGIMTTAPDGAITEFVEKPAQPRSNLASMGVYLFSWQSLKHYLCVDEAAPLSSHDFGKNIIPSMLNRGAKLYAFPFRDYWRDVGTVESFHEAHMELLADPPAFALLEGDWPIRSTLADIPGNNPVRFESGSRSLIGGGCAIRGDVARSVVFSGARIDSGATVRNSVVMSGARVCSGARVENAVIGPAAIVENRAILLGSGRQPAIVGHNTIVSPYAMGFGA